MSKFKRTEELYQMTFDSSDPETIRIGEIDVVLPDVPPEKKMFNYKEKRNERKYKRTIIPKEIKGWRKDEIDSYVKMQWHRRLNGEWWIIKDEPHYLPGSALFFFDWWTMHSGRKPDFRIEALQLFQYWTLFVERDPDLFGLFLMKPRRIGDTEKLLSIVYDRSTRYRGVKAGLQSYTDDEAAGNYSRLRTGHRSMPFFFKPLHSGSDQFALSMMRPSELMTMKKLREKVGKIDLKDEEKQFIGSFIDFEATVTGKYDGQQLWTYYLDEIFKIMPHQMDVKEQWRNIKKVQSLFNDQVIYGKSILGSTVEEKTKDADKKGIETTVEVATYLWDNSNPADRDDNNRTYTGLARLFRDYKLNAVPDEFGYPKVEQAIKFREEKLKKFREKGDLDEIISLMRKEPDSPEEALTQFSSSCPLHPEYCFERINQIKYGLDRHGDAIPGYKPKVVEGELVWRNGEPNTEVLFVPKLGGKWHISHMPRQANNVSWRPAKFRDSMGEMVVKNVYWPNNMAFYRMGCDPYDSGEVVGKGSDGAFAVKRRLYLPDETNDIQFDALGGIVNPQDLVTNQYVVDYKYRHKNPKLFYWDVVKTCWFFGVQVFVELDKPGLRNWMIENGYAGFLQYEPAFMLSSALRRKARMGAKATTDVINAYVEKLVSYTSTYVWAQHHPRILESWAHFVPAKRTKFDLAVATGFTELADGDNRFRKDDKKEELNRWSNQIYNEVAEN